MHKNKLRGFTFIEILVVIGVFAIGVFAVVRVLTSNILNVNSIKTRNSAVFLAKEGMDIVQNIKSSNISKGLKWDCIIKDSMDVNAPIMGNVDDVCKYFFSSGINDSKIFQIGFDPKGYFIVNEEKDSDFTTNFDNNRIFYYSGKVSNELIYRYGYRGLNYPGAETKFSRYIKIKPIKEGNNILPIDKIVKIESHVLYKNGSKTGDVVLESFISAY